jgi:hypothetical protein
MYVCDSMICVCECVYVCIYIRVCVEGWVCKGRIERWADGVNRK